MKDMCKCNEEMCNTIILNNFFITLALVEIINIIPFLSIKFLLIKSIYEKPIKRKKKFDDIFRDYTKDVYKVKTEIISIRTRIRNAR